MPARTLGGIGRSSQSPLWYFDFRTCDTAIDPRIALSRASASTRTDSTGALVPVASGSPVLFFDPVSLANKGLRVLEQRTNKCTNYNAAPDAGLSNVIKTGDAAATLTRELDTTALAAAKLSSIVTSGYVFKLDNSLGTTPAFATINGTVGNTNKHSASCYIRGGTGYIGQPNGVGGANFSASSAYVRRQVDDWTPAFTTTALLLRADAGQTLWFVLNQLEEGTFSTATIIVAGAQATRIADLPVLSGLSLTEGTLVVTGEIIGGTSATFPHLAALTSSNPNSDAIGLLWTANNGALRGGVTAGGVSSVDVPGTANLVAGSSFKCALAFSNNYAQAAFGAGVISSVDTSVTVPATDRLTMGGPVRFQPTASMYLQTLALYARVLGPRELLELTP